MDKVKGIDQNLSKINTLILHEEEVYEGSDLFYDAMGARLGFRNKLEDFRDFYSTFSSLKSFFSDATLNYISEKLKPLLELYEEYSTSEKDITDEQSSLDTFYKAIDGLPKLREVSIHLPENLTEEDLVNFVNFLQHNYHFFMNYSVEEFMTKTSLISSKQSQSNLINLYNSIAGVCDFNKIREINDRDKINKLIDTNEYFKVLTGSSVIENKRKEVEALDQEIQTKENKLVQLNQKEVEVNQVISSQSNEKLQQVFGKKAEDLTPEIKDLHTKIITLFSLIISLIFSMFLYIAFNHDFKIERFYILYLSIFLTLSAVLTYLIRERIRLVKYQHYCNISFLEIDALSTYTAQLNDTDKIEDLKIQLAYRYFQGPNGDSNQAVDEKDLSFLSSKINELTNMVKDIKSLGEK